MPLKTNLANGASTNNINHGAMSGVDWTTFTVGGWWMPSAVTLNQRGIWAKGVSAGARLNMKQGNSSLGELVMTWVRATTNTTYVTASGILAANRPVCVFVTGDQNGAASSIFHVYTRTLITPLAEVSYSSRIDGSGAFSSIAAQSFRMNSSEVPDVAFPGEVFCAWVFENRILTLDQMTELSNHYESHRGMQANLACKYGANGTGRVFDESGHNNHGTITGAIPTSTALPKVFRRVAA
jgi:hypothetical protein